MGHIRRVLRVDRLDVNGVADHQEAVWINPIGKDLSPVFGEHDDGRALPEDRGLESPLEFRRGLDELIELRTVDVVDYGATPNEGANQDADS